MSATEAPAEAGMIDDDVRTALGRIPLLAGHDAAAFAVQRLGGLTNRVYRVALGEQAWCLRLPGQGTEAYIDRQVEAVNARAAAAAGVSPEVLFVDPTGGLMLTRFLDGVVTMSPAGFRERAKAPERAGAVFRRLHDSGQAFAFRFELFAMIDSYLEVLAARGAALPPGYHDVVAEAGTVREALRAHEWPLVPCHCDPLCENLLDTGNRMWLVDWEYSGMNDPMWDLGDLSVEGGFDAGQDEELLRGYFGGEAGTADRGRMVVYKAMCDLLWTLWGLIQHVDGNPAEDFWAYALGRFERCKTLMASPEFTRHLAAVRAG
jgi:thiamine kinase-like enzyme